MAQKATAEKDLSPDGTDDGQSDSFEGGVNFTSSVESLDGDEEVLSRFEEFTRMGVNGLIDQGAKFADLYSKSLATLEALAEVCVALMTKYTAPVWDQGGDPRSEVNKLKSRGYVAPKDKDKKVKDWGGQSEQYKKAIQKIYDKAGAGNNESQIRNNLKYWRQNLVKKVAPSEDLVALGMKTEKRGAGGAAKATTSATKKTTATAVTNTPVKVLEQIGPRVVQLREDVIKKKVVKTQAEKDKMIVYIDGIMDSLMKIWAFLDPTRVQTEEARAASVAEAKATAAAKGGRS